MRSWYHTALLSVYIISCVSSLNETFESCSIEPSVDDRSDFLWRLPTNALPLRYILEIKIYVPGYNNFTTTSKETFDGEVYIKFQIVTPTDHITVNSHRLNIYSYELQGGRNLSIKYSGQYGNLSGLYPSIYNDENYVTRYIVITQLEPTDARTVVPCFDEPHMKATWTVTIIHPVGTKALSNGLELETIHLKNDSGWQRTAFKESLPMSSYLLALAVVDFHYNEGKTKKNTTFRIWSRKEALTQTEFALDVGIKAIEFFESYYGIDFPLEKQDMLAVPDFAAGAMENWGLVTFRETFMLYDPALYTPDQKANVATTITHEIAHQWFGNMVTMKWWDDLWLNEGFASFMQYLGASAATDGHMQRDIFFLVNAMGRALQFDAEFCSSHPLANTINKADDVAEAFDDISYYKGASVLYMIEKTTGTEVFKRGLNIYLERYKYKNAAHDDLWIALDEAFSESAAANASSYTNISQFISSWITQPGYPVVTVTRTDPKSLVLTQKRFLYNAGLMDTQMQIYDVPVWYEINGVEQPMKWLRECLKLNVNEGDLFVMNTLRRGLIRVNYDAEGWMQITKKLLEDYEAFDVRTRAAIVDDAFALAEAGLLSYEVPLNVTRYLQNDFEALPWAKALTGLEKIQLYFSNEPEAQDMRAYLGKLLEPMYKKIDWDELKAYGTNDTVLLQSILNTRVILRYCQMLDQGCVDKLRDFFQKKFLDACRNTTKMSSECSEVPPSIRRPTYCEGVKRGTDATWNTVFSYYQKERVQVEQHRLLAALSCSTDTVTLKKMLRMAADPKSKMIRKQDVHSVFEDVSRNDVGREIIFYYFLDNWPTIYENLRSYYSLLRHVIISSTFIKTQRQIDELEAFMAKQQNETDNLDPLKAQLEAAKVNKQWMDRNFDKLAAWFKRQLNDVAKSDDEESDGKAADF